MVGGGWKMSNEKVALGALSQGTLKSSRISIPYAVGGLRGFYRFPSIYNKHNRVGTKLL